MPIELIAGSTRAVVAPGLGGALLDLVIDGVAVLRRAPHGTINADEAAAWPHPAPGAARVWDRSPLHVRLRAEGVRLRYEVSPGRLEVEIEGAALAIAVDGAAANVEAEGPARGGGRGTVLMVGPGRASIVRGDGPGVLVRPWGPPGRRG